MAPARGREGLQIVVGEEKSILSTAQLSMDQFVGNGDLPKNSP